MPDMIAAIDGGGTKTAAALADRRGNLIILPALTGCNPQDNPDWATVLTHAMTQITARVRSPAHVVLGLAGHGEVPAHDSAIAGVVAAALPGNATILNDVALAFHGAFAGDDGVLILAGTGSMAMASGPNGLVRVGGWGDLIGDEGSAFWIGRRALALTACALDGRDADQAFTGALLAALGLDAGTDRFAPLNWLMAKPHPRSAIASVARQVDALANAGDPTAWAILKRAAGHLALQGRAAAAKAGLGPEFNWAHAGSVFQSATVAAEVSRLFGRAPVTARLNALGGGLWLGAVSAGWAPDAAWLRRVGAATTALAS